MEMGIPKYLNYLNNHQHQIEIYSKQTVHIKINRGNSIQILHHARKRQLFLNKTKRKNRFGAQSHLFATQITDFKTLDPQNYSSVGDTAKKKKMFKT